MPWKQGQTVRKVGDNKGKKLAHKITVRQIRKINLYTEYRTDRGKKERLHYDTNIFFDLRRRHLTQKHRHCDRENAPMPRLPRDTSLV